MAASITLNQYQVNGRYKGVNEPLPELPDDFFVINPFVSDDPLHLFSPLPDQVNPSIRHGFNTTYPGATYRQLIQFKGGKPPYRYELFGSLEGATIGEFLVEDGDGNLDPDSNYAVITKTNMPAGSFNIFVRATDQAQDSDVCQFILESNLALNFFVAPTNVGAGTGVDAANARSIATTYVGATTDSPAKGKVVRQVAGDYTAFTTTMYLSPQYNPMSWLAVTGQAVTMKNRIFPTGDDLYLQGQRFTGIDIDVGGSIHFEGQTHRHTFHELEFDGMLNTAGGGNNAACIGSNLLSGGATTRNNITIVGCTFKNSPDVHDFDLYSIESLVYERNQSIIDNPAITALGRSRIFPKSTCYNVQIAYCTFDNDDISPIAPGIIQLYNAMEANAKQTYKLEMFYCKYRSAASGGDIENCLITSNGAANSKVSTAGAVTITNRIERCSFSGPVSTKNFDRAWSVERRTFYANNAVQNPQGGIPTPVTPTNSPVWFSKTGTECEGTAGMFDDNMNLTGAYAVHAGTKGAQLRRAP